MKTKTKAPNNPHLEFYIMELANLPNTERQSFENGKEYRYEKQTIVNTEGHIQRFLNFIGNDVRRIDGRLIESYCKTVKSMSVGPHYKHYLLKNAQRFTAWLHERNELTDLNEHWDVGAQPQAHIRKIPRRIPNEMLDDLRSRGDSARDRAIMSLIFYGFRIREIAHLSWTGFPLDYFAPLKLKKNGEPIMNEFRARRKRGEIWPCVVDIAAWNALKELWLHHGQPVPANDDIPRFGTHLPHPVFEARTGTQLSTGMVQKTFKKYRDRVFCRPEHRQIREMLPPHAIRHLWIQRLRDIFPDQVALMAPIGGWVPGSKAFLNYLNLRDNAARSFGRQIGAINIFSAEPAR